MQGHSVVVLSLGRDLTGRGLARHMVSHVTTVKMLLSEMRHLLAHCWVQLFTVCFYCLCVVQELVCLCMLLIVNCANNFPASFVVTVLHAFYYSTF